MKCMDKHEFEQQNVFGTGAANTAYAKFFIGQSFLNPLTDPKTGLFLATLPLSPAAATTGTSTITAVRSFFVRRVGVIIRSGANPLRN